MNFGSIVTVIQFFFAVVIGLYFWNLLKSQQGTKVAVERESKKEIEKLRRLRAVSLTVPLSEKTRPGRLDEIVGQDEGIRALRAALCGPNPQHVIVYGPPGVGKTAAARLILAEAKTKTWSPFQDGAKFVEIDATTARFDERGIADPLIGSVHDPIYQGAGPLGIAGVPQPKPGAVTKAHGGILFIDEIGELHPIQMNKLLKVLEDRKVFLESAYYTAEDAHIPLHIQDVFENGLPADFRLIGATTRRPHEIPPAIRSRCVEIYFRALLPDEVERVAAHAVMKMGMDIEPGGLEVIRRFATNGREAVNLVQMAAGLGLMEGGRSIRRRDIEWVVGAGQYTPRPERTAPTEPAVGLVNGLAVYGPNLGTLLEVEAAAHAVERGRGRLTVTGIIDEEEMGLGGRTVRRKSMAVSSVENVLTVLRRYVPDIHERYQIHVNFGGGVPVDGPSAGVAVAAAIYSAMAGVACDNRTAMTGELSIRGMVKPVGGIAAKIAAAQQAGCQRVIIPRDNWQESFRECGIQVVPVDTFAEVLESALLKDTGPTPAGSAVTAAEWLSASAQPSAPV